MANAPVVFLIGFMGSGKSTVGPALAARLAVPFIDLDARIEARTGQAASALFARDGEAAFRALEQTTLRGLEGELIAGAVVATGGGSVIDPANREWMDARGIPVWLDATLEAIRHRVARDGTRPLFTHAPALARLYEERRATYASAPFRVDTTGRTPEEIAGEVAALVRKNAL